MLWKKKCFLLAFITGLIFFSSWSYAQDWKGKGRIEGVVLGEEGEPVPNAKVTFTHLRLQATFSKTTNEKGVFKAAWIKGGRWHVDVQADGYLPRKLVAQVSEIIQNIPMEIFLKKTEKTVVEEELRDAVKTLLNEGNTLFEQKKYEDALVKFKEILEQVPESKSPIS